MHRTIWIFVAVAYGLSIALALVVGLTGGHQSPLIGLQFLSMFFPAMAMLIASRLPDGAIGVDWRRFPLSYVPVALFLLPAVMHAAMLPVVVAYEGRLPWHDRFTPGHIVINASVGLVVVSALAVFEEIGWRAWLLPRLQQRLGTRRAIIAVSAIWAVWHVPFQLSGVQHIEGASPVALALTLPFGIFAAGLVLGWLWMRTESIWIVSLAHGALNNWGQYALKYMQFVKAPDLVVAGAGFLAVFVVGVVLLSMLSSRREVT